MDRPQLFSDTWLSTPTLWLCYSSYKCFVSLCSLHTKGVSVITIFKMFDNVRTKLKYQTILIINEDMPQTKVQML